MYRMSVISFLITNEAVNRDKCIKMAVVHDMAEALVGDITPFDPVAKSRRELETMIFVIHHLPEYNPKAAEEILELLARL